MADVDAATERNPNEISVNDFNSYEDYLDAQITPIDLYYLEDKDLARQLVELGYRGTGEPLKREEFETRKRVQETSRFGNKRTVTATAEAKGMAGDSVSVAEEKDGQSQPRMTPFLQALLEREESNRNGKMSSIIFIRDRNNKNQEISGYVDFAQRLKNENFDDYFNQSKKLLPKPSDLSFYNWDTHVCVANASQNYQVVAEGSQGLLFKNKRDRKTISVDPKDEIPGDNTTRMELTTSEYVQVVFYDHVIRRKT